MKNKIKTEYKNIPVSDLVPYARNARTHSPAQIDQIAASISEFTFLNPVLVEPDGSLIAGHGRLLAAQKLKIDTIPAIVIKGLSEAQKRALVLADNKIALNAGWDDEMLANEIKSLIEDGYDPAITGFDEDEISRFISGEGTEGLTDEDEFPLPPEEPITRLGDIWLLGDHRLMCEDSTSIDAVEKLMGGQKADMVFTDPPYNVDYGANDNPRHKIRTIKNDKMNSSDWDGFVTGYLTALFTFCEGNIYISMSDKELGHLQLKFVHLGGKWASFIIWVKDQLVLSAKDYHSRHETILYGWKDGVKRRKRVEDRTNDDVWEIPRPKNSEEHPTMKPVELVEKCIKNSSNHGEVVLDLFGGSGTTIIACEKTGRNARLMELDPKYCDVIVKRWEDFTGRKAELETKA